MFPILQLGPLAIQTPGLILLVGVWVGLHLSGKRAIWHGLESNALDNLVLAMLFGFAAGGRLMFVAINFSTFQSAPLDAFSLNFELFDISGGLAAGLLAGGVHAARSGFSLWPTLDALTPFAATIFVAIGLAHFASGAAYGEPTSTPVAIQLRGTMRHPSQVYESLGAFIILLGLGLRKPHAKAGMLFLLFAAASSSSSLFLQAFRGDGKTIAFGVRPAQAAAWIILAVVLAFLDQRIHSPSSQTQEVNPSRGQ